MGRIKVAFRLEMILLLLLISLTSIFPFALAANDPGHDVLYIEQQGNSELNGTLNISQQLKVANRLYSSYLEILGNGSQPTGSFPQIYASDANTLTINSVTSLYLLKDAGSMVYVGGTNVNLNISGALFFGGDNELHTSAAGSASSLSLYWGDKLLCNTTVSNCGWVSSASGGDITAVNTSTDSYIYNGSEAGDVYLRLNETKLNATIDARASATGDGNNYTRAIGFNVTGGTATLQLNRTGMVNLTANLLMNDTTRALAGNCTGSQVIQNATPTGVQCITVVTGSETDPIWTNNYSGIITAISNKLLNSSFDNTITAVNSSITYRILNSSVYNITQIDNQQSAQNNTINSKGNLSAQGAAAGYIAQFQNASVVNNSVIFQSGTSIGIGDTSPDALLDVQSSSAANQLRVSYDDSNYGNISVNSGGNMTIRATGHVIIDIS